jgi:hypothetical protein
MRSRSRVGAWAVGLTVTAVVLTLGCGGGSQSGTQLNAVAFGNGTFVAVGLSDTSFTNQGNGYQRFTTGVPTLNDVAYASTQGLFVAVGDGGAIVTSPDGVAWTQQGSPTAVNLHGVAAGTAALVAVGDGGTILTSLDGVAWTQRSSGTDAPLLGVGFGGDTTFVAVGGGGAVDVSDDAGLTWQATVEGPGDDLNAAAYGTNGWVVVGQAGVILQGAAPDALDLIGFAVLPNLNDVIFTQNLFLVVGDNGNILSSPDGMQYTSSVSNTGQFLYGAAFGATTDTSGNTSSPMFVVVGSGGRVLTSGDTSVFQNGKI